MGITFPQIEVARERRVTETSQSFERPSAWITLLNALFFCASRLAFGGFLLVTSVYCLLMCVPFAYFGFIHNALLSWLPPFVRLHGLIYGVLLGPIALTFIPDLRRKETRGAAASFLALNAGIFVYLWTRSSLANLQPDFTSYLWSLFSLFPILWLAVFDLSRAGASESRWLKKRHGLKLAQIIIAAVIASFAFACISALREMLQSNSIAGGLALRGLAASLCFHVTIFLVVGLILVVIKLAVKRTSSPELLNFILARILAWFLFAELLRTLILPTISFQGVQADIFTAIVSIAILLTGFAISANWRMLIADFPRHAWSKLAALWYPLAAVVLLASAYAIPALIGPTDWDFVLQRMAVLAVWLFVLQVVYWSGFRIRRKTEAIALGLVITASVAGFAGYGKSALYNPAVSSTSRDFLDTYAGTDISFKTAYDVLSWSVHDKAYGRFYEFLKQHTNLGSDTPVNPVDLPIVSDLRPTPGTKPNIFVFVIDSLRQDYISPYNPSVDYTPEIGRFARDSVVLKNAFTRYGGTALSEPAIWVGAMQLHKQYIQPFYSMNNLQKLLETDGYHSYVSLDPIVYAISQRSEAVTPLDTDNKGWGDLDFVPTLKELENKIDSRSDPQKPIFAYTQPQNVHTLTLERSKIKGGRHGAILYELKRMDTAFGEFVRFLQERGLYDNSIIILTADHGDCYGEFGRWGHADFLFPQVMRIPLIIHLPPRMRDQMTWDANQVALSTDITPTLYYLLGHRPILNKELFGRPLFTQSLQEQTPYLRPYYLLVCSYAPVYAILDGKARSLFIVDAVNLKNYYYDLTEDPTGAHNRLTMQLRDENEALIRQQLGLLDKLYNWQPSAQP